MKNKIIIILVLIVSTIVLYKMCNHYKQIRPIKIKVIDKKTKEPIKGALLYYQLGADTVESIFYIIHPYATHWPISKIAERYQTDSNGEISIASRKISLNIKETFDSEQIAVNIDRINDDISYTEENEKTAAEIFFKYFTIHDCGTDLEKYFNPIKKYGGFFIINIYTGAGHAGTIHKRKVNDLMWNPYSLSKDSENLTIELERW